MSEFEGEFIHKTEVLQSACEYDGRDQAISMPYAAEIQQLFISQITLAVKAGAHRMLADRTADILMNTSLAYANCRFEELHYVHFLQLTTLAEDIILKTAATKQGNLGESQQKPRYERNQGKDLHLPTGNATKWQRQERSKEVRTNATVANAGDITDLQVCIGDYQNTTKYFTSKNKVWCAPVREYAEGVCTNCKKKHSIGTLCDGGEIAKPTDSGNRHSLWQPERHGEGHGSRHFQTCHLPIPRRYRGTAKSEDMERSSRSRSTGYHCLGQCEQ